VQSTGLEGGQVGHPLKIAAPLVMGALGQQQQQQGFDINDLSAFLGNQQQAGQQSNPDMMSMLNNLLDMDQDGSAVNDVLGMVGKLFGKKKSINAMKQSNFVLINRSLSITNLENPDTISKLIGR